MLSLMALWRFILMPVLLFSPLASAADLTLKPLDEQAFNGEWQWSNPQGQLRQMRLHFSQELLKQSAIEQFRISYSLTYPTKAISAYLNPRLEHALVMINQYAEQPTAAPKDILKILASNPDTPSSEMLWEAYQQYTQDAFRHLGLLPCRHPRGTQYPCVRPNYSQLFYQNRNRMLPLIKNFQPLKDLNQTLAEAQAWLLTIPVKREISDSFSPPLHVLKDNLADSDERALLLALMLSELAPDYSLYMVYPAHSVGSASPAWLTIDANSGIEGPTITLGQHTLVLISGSSELINEMQLADVELISDALY
ncbi:MULTISPECIES: hypothetical protein [unclassified Agarivorans]|uniref:hypothetical protein n=1 Tax=unclassified Agarivorans TaxID=2636026 RepID=UPI003D7ED54E